MRQNLGRRKVMWQLTIHNAQNVPEVAWKEEWFQPLKMLKTTKTRSSYYQKNHRGVGWNGIDNERDRFD